LIFKHEGHEGFVLFVIRGSKTMTHRNVRPMVAGLLAVAAAVSILSAQQPAPPDQILTNGKIITVDARFSIAQAVAIRGDRIIAVGSNQDITRLAGPSTRRIDLRGRSVVPGMIDNHAHFQEEGEYWTLENRLDGIETRKEVLEKIRANAKAKGPGQWVYTLGGFSPDQFTDKKGPFLREELDQAAPDNPVLLQFTRVETYLNSRAIQAIGLDKMTQPWIKRDASGRPTGVVEDAGAGAVRNAAGFLKNVPKEIFETSQMAMLKDLNRAGLTASGGSCDFEDEYRQWMRQGRVGMRFFCFRTVGTGQGAEGVDKALPQISKLRYFDGDEWMDHVNWGERLYGVVDNVTDTKPMSPPEAFVQWGRVAREVAKAGIPIQIHSTMEWTIEQQLAQVEAVNKEIDVRRFRWAFMHLENITPAQIERMKRLNMFLAVNPRGVISGASFIRLHGDKAYAFPPLKYIQDSGIMWGLGTDAFEVNQYRPFTTLYWAVTGKMVGGTVVLKQPVSREDALIAHTRSNAYLFFRENDLGSIQPGRLADLVVLDRDYLTIPADQIKDIKPVLTMVGGKVFFDAETEGTR
jgi:predicted amidohydrolase YtcJ